MKKGVPQSVASSAAPDKQARDLAAELRRKIRGEVRFDDGARALYATDLSIYRQVPIGVVIPRDVSDVEETVAACRKHDVPVLGRGCGTSLAGQTCNVAVVIDFSKYMHRQLMLDARKKLARVEPGIIRDDLNDAAEKHHLTFAPDPATHKYCTVGGMIGNNSCGVHSVMGGRTSDNVEELDVLTYDGLRLKVGRTSDAEIERAIRGGGREGEIYAKLKALRDKYASEIRQRYPQIPRRVSGYNLDELLPEKGFNVARALTGSESTCVLILSATARLLDSPPHRALIVVAYPDIFLAGDHSALIRSYGCIGLEAFQKHVIENMTKKGNRPEGAKLLPDGDSWLLAEFGGRTADEAWEKARDAARRLRSEGKGHLEIKIFENPGEQREVWHIRESGVGASRVPGLEDAWPSWEDAAVPPEVLGNYLRDFYKLLQKFDYKWTIYGHFGDGCIHTRITFDLKTPEGVKAFRRFMEEAAGLVVSYGGSLSGEHGDGQARAELLPRMFGSRLVEAFREFKTIWDPHWRMNPGKVVDAYPLDTNLRAGPDYKPKRVATHFKFPEDHGSFAAATERCFGVGKCRGLDGGTMCPSFMATREEMHATRGRAHLLFEMMRGDALKNGWQDEHVHDALDLCLSCKGCKADCPVSVDMATYKAEFLSHYYAEHQRPPSAYALGLIDVWARLASMAPHVANFVTQTPVVSALAKSFAGLAYQRPVPPFAGQTFRQWFVKRRAATNGRSRPPVLLWPDTFNNYFLPHTAQAAVEVLENLGYDVQIPGQPLCCGRALYDYGMLDRAERYLREILAALRPQISAGVPVVVLEPSCLAVFRDEMPNLMPEDESAQRLKSQTFHFGEFISRDKDHSPPKLRRDAIVHGHCHHKAVGGMKAEEDVLKRMATRATLLDSGCCGLAGSFGYEQNHYAVSMKAGERVLLPAVRSAPKDTLIIANGFSCREQIAQNTRRHALHLAEVMQMAIHQGPEGPSGKYPERRYVQEQVAAPSTAEFFLLAASALIAGGLWLGSKS